MSRSLTSSLYSIARALNTINAVRKGRVVNRAKNIVIGRAIGRSGIWRQWWGR